MDLMLNLVLYPMGLVLSLLTAASLLASWYWVFELISNFHPQLVAASLFLFLLSFLAGRFRLALTLFCCLIVNVLPLVDYFETKSLARIDASAVTTDVRVLAFNAHRSIGALEKLNVQISEEQPTFVLLTEFPSDLEKIIGELAQTYPHIVYETKNSPFDVLFLSAWPIKTWEIKRKLDFLPLLKAEVCSPDNKDYCMTIFGLHAPRPLSEVGVRIQTNILQQISQMANERNGPVLVMGDLNTTPWTPTFSRFIKTSQLRNSAMGFQWQSTWLSRSPLFGLALDHILINRYVSTRNWWVGNALGSDHFPVAADLTVRWP
jgi:endonuclease/exonuclease/phosphatase (EEP) superfamily protein YafD